MHYIINYSPKNAIHDFCAILWVWPEMHCPYTRYSPTHKYKHAYYLSQWPVAGTDSEAGTVTSEFIQEIYLAKTVGEHDAINRDKH